MDPKLIYHFGDAATIGRLAKFLSECAEEMRDRKPFHRHFRDLQRDWDMKLLEA